MAGRVLRSSNGRFAGSTKGWMKGKAGNVSRGRVTLSQKGYRGTNKLSAKAIRGTVITKAYDGATGQVRRVTRQSRAARNTLRQQAKLAIRQTYVAGDVAKPINNMNKFYGDRKSESYAERIRETQQRRDWQRQQRRLVGR